MHARLFLLLWFLSKSWIPMQMHPTPLIHYRTSHRGRSFLCACTSSATKLPLLLIPMLLPLQCRFSYQFFILFFKLTSLYYKLINAFSIQKAFHIHGLSVLNITKFVLILYIEKQLSSTKMNRYSYYIYEYKLGHYLRIYFNIC